MICIGHRGAAGHHPENTLGSVEAALRMGAEWVEVDVHCVEGRLVVIHDSTLDRTTSGKGPLDQAGLALIRSLDAGQGEKVPLLEEIMDRTEGRAGLHIELKSRGTAGPVVRIIQEAVARGNRTYRDLVVSSFDHALLRRVHRLDPRIHLGVLFQRPGPAPVWKARRLGARSLHVPARFVTAGLVRRAHGRNMQVLAFTVNDETEIQRLEDLGIDGLFTDFPDRLIGFRTRPGLYSAP